MVTVITLWNPWASLIHPDVGMKHIETRSWPAPDSLIGQPLAIHAAKRPMGDEEQDLCAMHFDQLDRLDAWRVRPNGGEVAVLPMGAILSVALLQACIRVPSGAAHLVRTREYPQGITVPPPEPERSFGDYTPGRFAWVLSDIVPLPSPIPAKGSQGFWTTADPVVCRIAEEIRARYAAGLPRQEVLF